MSATTRRRSGRIASKPEPTTPSLPATYSDDGEEDGSEEESKGAVKVKDENEQRELSVASSASTSTRGAKVATGTGRPRGRPPKKKNKQAATTTVPLPSSSPYTTQQKGKGKQFSPSTIIHLSPTHLQNNNNNNNNSSIIHQPSPHTLQPSYLTHPPLSHPLSTSTGGILPGNALVPFPLPPPPHHLLPPLHQQGMIHLPLGVGSAQYQHFEHAPPPPPPHPHHPSHHPSSSSTTSSSGGGAGANLNLTMVDPRLLGMDPSLDVRSRAPSDAFTSGSAQSLGMGMGEPSGMPLQDGFGGQQGGLMGGVGVGGGQGMLVGEEQENGLTRLYRDIGRILYVDMRESQELLGYLIGQIQQNANAFDRAVPPERQGPQGRAALDSLARSACLNIESVKKIYSGPGGRGSGWECVGIWLITKAFDVWIGSHLP